MLLNTHSLHTFFTSAIAHFAVLNPASHPGATSPCDVDTLNPRESARTAAAESLDNTLAHRGTSCGTSASGVSLFGFSFTRYYFSRKQLEWLTE